MARFTFQGLDRYVMQLNKLKGMSEETAGKVIYAGADVVADAIRKNIDSLPVVDFRKKGSSSSLIDGVTSAQKKGIQDGFGITPMKEENGYFNVKLGFDGYNTVKSKKYPQGQPNVMIARAVESGTSFRKKHPFVSPAVKATRSEAEKRMAEVLEQEIQKIME